MSDNKPPRDGAGDTARRAESDVTAELERVARLQDDSVETPADLAQHPQDLDYFNAELTSLRNALRAANTAAEEP